MAAAAGKAAGAAAKTVAKAAAAPAAAAAGAKGKYPTPQRDLALAMGHGSAAASLAAALPLAQGIAREAAALMTLRPSFPMTLHPVTRLLTPGAPLPDRAPSSSSSSSGGTMNKRLRLHPYWKLRPVRRWVDFAPLIKEISIRFDPSVDGFGGARELARQARSSKALAAFPGCAVKVEELADGSLPMVVVRWVRVLLEGGGGLVGCACLLARRGRAALTFALLSQHAPPRYFLPPPPSPSTGQ
jgi:hypothetical protein